jgi:hypothetical protein
VPPHGFKSPTRIPNHRSENIFIQNSMPLNDKIWNAKSPSYAKICPLRVCGKLCYSDTFPKFHSLANANQTIKLPFLLYILYVSILTYDSKIKPQNW